MASRSLNLGPVKCSATKSFGSALERARKSLGWSQERTARELGVSTNTVQNWESDTSRPVGLAWLSRCPAIADRVLAEFGYERRSVA